jgi:YidC/Oxa1 family membrane protein insertase
MDRTAWIVITLCVIGLVAWEWWTIKNQPLRPAVVSSPTPAPLATVSPSATATVSSLPSASAPPEPQATPAFAEKNEVLRNDDVELHLTNRGGGISEAVLLKHIAQGDQRVVLNSKEQSPIGAMIEKPDTPNLAEFNLNREPDGSIKCERVADNVTVTKKFFFLPNREDHKDNFLFEMDVDLVNGSDKPYSDTGYYVTLGSAVPIHPRESSYNPPRLTWFVGGKDKGTTDVNWFAPSNGLFGLLGQRPAQSVYQRDLTNVDWAAVSNQFFTTLIAPLAGKGNGVWGRRFDISPEQKMYGLAGALRMPGFQLPPGQTYSAKFEIWAGPKIYHRLARLDRDYGGHGDHNEAEVLDFGSWLFKLVAQFLLNCLNGLHDFIRSYGLSILVLTAIIKMVLWPIQNKANKSMRQMAVLSPKMQELREKYKDDPTRMNQEVMKLYKQYGINPVGGCLPMMIQIPIFFGLFRMLGQAVELRGAHFLWVKDLSQPDTLFVIPGLGWIPFIGDPGVGLPINIIPLCMAATQIWLMAMTPKTGDATQRRMMMFTPLIFLFICYNFAAALALYYTTQNLFSILQFYINKRQPVPTLEKVAPAGKRK